MTHINPAAKSVKAEAQAPFSPQKTSVVKYAKIASLTLSKTIIHVIYHITQKFRVETTIARPDSTAYQVKMAALKTKLGIPIGKNLVQRTLKSKEGDSYCNPFDPNPLGIRFFRG